VTLRNEEADLISRGDAIVAIARHIEGGQYVISIPPQIALTAMSRIAHLEPFYYLDKGTDEILTATDGDGWVRDSVQMIQDMFGDNRIAAVAVLPVGASGAALAAALNVPEQPPTLVMLSPSHADPDVNFVVDLLLSAIGACNPAHAQYLREAAQAYEERYGTEE